MSTGGVSFTGSSREAPASKPTEVVGRTQFFPIVGLKSCFLAACQLGATLSSWRPHSNPPTWGPTSQNKQEYTESFSSLEASGFLFYPISFQLHKRKCCVFKDFKDWPHLKKFKTILFLGL